MQTQNSKNQTPGGQYMNGDKAVQMQAKRQKKIIRSNTSYTDGAIARAKMLRGAM